MRAGRGARGPRAGGVRPTIWSTAQYLSYAPTHSTLDLTVTLAAEGRRTTQGRVVGRVGDREILTVNGAVGSPGSLDAEGVWVTAPDVPSPDDCPPRWFPDFRSASIFDRIDVRQASGRSFEDITAGLGGPGRPPARCGPGCPAISSLGRDPGHHR